MPETVGAQRNPFLSLPIQPHPSGAYVATLADDWDKFYAAKRSSSTRKRERRELKHLAEHGDVRFVDVQETDDIARTLDDLMAQKSRAFARMGVENIFARPGYREFFLDVATDHNVGALTHVSRLDVGSTSAAVNLGLTFRDSYYLVLSSYHDGDLAKFGPGRAHLHQLMRHAIDRGFSRFDFTVGDEGYKRDWSDTVLRLYDYLAAETPRGWLFVALTSSLSPDQALHQAKSGAVAHVQRPAIPPWRPAPSLTDRRRAPRLAASECRGCRCGRVRTLCYKHLRAIRCPDTGKWLAQPGLTLYHFTGDGEVG